MTGKRHRRAAGYSMVALIAMLAIMSFALMLALPSWRYLAQDDREQELIFRGRQIANAVARFQRKNGNALPASFEQLVEGKYLRKAYKDPLTRDGAWRILRPGEGVAAPAIAPGGGAGRPTPSPTPSATPVFGANSGGGQSGPIAGVVSRSAEKGLRTVNGTTSYNRWMFAPNVPFVIGAQTVGGRPPGGGPNQAPPPQGVRAPDLELPRVSR